MGTREGNAAVVVDTDINFDDALAILYLLQREDVDVAAITVTGTGLAHLDPGARNVLRLLDLAAAPGDLPVAAGAAVPRAYEHASRLDPDWRRDADTLLGLAQDPALLPPTTRQLAAEPAAEVLRQAVERHGPVTVVALGPHTNLADALDADPGLAAGIERIVVMGGAVDVPGNVAQQVPGNEHAEWNVYLDPVAARRVFGAGIPILLVPLDATDRAPITTELCADFKRAATRSARPAARFVDRGFDALIERGSILKAGDPRTWYYFWDPLAAALAVDASLARAVPRQLEVLSEEGPECGRTRAASGGSAIDVALAPDVARIARDFIDVLNR